DRLAEDFLRAAEAALPQRVAEQHNRIAAGAIFFWQEGAPDLGTDAEHGEDSGSHIANRKAFGIAGAGQSNRGRACGFERLEGMALVAPIRVVFEGSADHGERAFFRDYN